MKNKKWSKEELNYLRTNWELLKIKTLSQKLDRTEYAIKNKASRIGLSLEYNSKRNCEKITLNSLIAMLGLQNSHSHWKNKFIKNNCPIEKRKRNSKTYYFINIDDFWEWAKKNKSVVDFYKFEENSLGPEPEWVKEKRKADIIGKTKKHKNIAWTKTEDQYLLSMCKRNKFTYEDISKELNRTEQAIKRRLSELGTKYRPVPRDNHTPWTKEEVNKLIDLYEKGYNSMSISKALNKSQQSTAQKIAEYKKTNTIKLAGKRLPWTKEEVETLISKSNKLSVDELCELLDRSKNAIIKKKERLGL